jgi:aminoglycoside 3-N-acetyltransferase
VVTTFDAVIDEYLATGYGMKGLVRTATSYLFDAKELTAFGVAWMERTFGVTSDGQ